MIFIYIIIYCYIIIYWPEQVHLHASAAHEGYPGDEFCIKNDDVCIKNDEFCIKN